MSVVCCFSFAGIFGVCSLVCLALATGTDFWFGVHHIHDHHKIDEPGNTNATDKFLYPYHMGLWLTCYEKNIPDTVRQEDLVREQCVLDYNFKTHNIEDFARTSVTSIVLACGIILTAGILGFAGCICRKQTPLLTSGIFLFASCIVTLIGMCTFIGRILLQQSDPDIPIPGDGVVAEFGWSFYVGWASLGLQLLTASILVGATKGCGSSYKSGDDFM